MISIGVTLSNRGALDQYILLAVLDTHASEAREFLGGTFDKYDYALAAMTFIPALALYIQQRKALFFKPRSRAYGVMLLLVLFFGQIAAKYSFAQSYTSEGRSLKLAVEHFKEEFPLHNYPLGDYLPLQLYVAFAGSLSVRNSIRDFAANFRPLEKATAIEPAHGRRTYIVVVGESLSKAHMQLYGYARETTPNLGRLARAGELKVFHDAVTTHAFTVPALTDALTWRRTDNSISSVIDIFNAASFKTYWISNQPSFGAFENSLVALITRSAHERSWLQIEDLANVEERIRWSGSAADKDSQTHDGLLVSKLKRALQDGSEDKAIFLHMMGSHYDYKARYPASAHHFTGRIDAACRTAAQDESINEYDNSVRYTDLVVSEIIEAARSAGGEAYVLFFSDHGEEVYDFRASVGHADNIISPYMAEIPLMVWLSDGYKASHPDFSKKIDAASGRAHINSNLSYLLADLSRLTFDGMRAESSIFSPSYVTPKRVVAGRDYDLFKQNWVPTTAWSNGRPIISCSANH